MRRSEIYEAQSIISTEISVHLYQIIALTDEYLNKFDRKDFFAFSGNEERDSIYKREYYSFVSALPQIIADLNASASRLSELLTCADAAYELELIGIIGTKTERILVYENQFALCVEESKKHISGENVSPSGLVSSMGRLKNITRELLEKINENL